jgi:hypothetical protein
MDIEALSADAKARYIRLGATFGSERTLAQGNKTLLGWRDYGPVIEPYGFVAEDAQDLKQCVEALKELGVGREGAIIDKKTNAVELLNLIKQGKSLRSRLRNLHITVSERLARSPSDDDSRLIAQLKATLDVTDTSGAEPQRLIDQLKLLLKSFDNATFTAAAAGRSGDALRNQAIAHIPKLQAAADALNVVRGTPEQTTRLNLIDGIIVELVRSARRAARNAASDLGRPELETIFGLSELYEG